MKSMTGYGTAEGKVGKGRLFMELKGVNHRFSELNLKIPGKMCSLEPMIRDYLGSKFNRGKLDVFFKEQSSLFGGATVSIDKDLARKYKKALEDLKKDIGLKGDIDFLRTVGLDRILKVEEPGGSYERLWPQVKVLLAKAAAQVQAMRAREGMHIMKDQKKRLARLQRLISEIGKQSGRVYKDQVSKIRKKVTTASNGQPVDEQRMNVEIAYIGGKQDIAEELVRLESHLKQYDEIMSKDGPVGRNLDFLLQEMNREANTIGSKGGDAKVSQHVVEVKAELERLKEQIQNIE